MFRTNRAMKRLSACQQTEYDIYIRCYICRHNVVEIEAKGFKVRNQDYITRLFISAPYSYWNFERPVSFYILVFFNNFRGYNAHLIVYDFGKRVDRELKVINQNIKKFFRVEWCKNMVFRDLVQFLPSFLKQLAASHAEVSRG